MDCFAVVVWRIPSIWLRHTSLYPHGTPLTILFVSVAYILNSRYIANDKITSYFRLLSTHADKQGVDISFKYCLCVLFVCLFVQLQISPPMIKLATSNFARWFIGVLGKESPILGILLPKSPKSDESASHREVKFTV